MLKGKIGKILMVYSSAVDSIYIIIMVLIMLSTDLSNIVIWLCCENRVEKSKCGHVHVRSHCFVRELVVVVQLLSYVQLCDPVDCSTPGYSVLHHFLEFALIHVH